MKPMCYSKRLFRKILLCRDRAGTFCARTRARRSLRDPRTLLNALLIKFIWLGALGYLFVASIRFGGDGALADPSLLTKIAALIAVVVFVIRLRRKDGPGQTSIEEAAGGDGRVEAVDVNDWCRAAGELSGREVWLLDSGLRLVGTSAEERGRGPGRHLIDVVGTEFAPDVLSLIGRLRQSGRGIRGVVRLKDGMTSLVAVQLNSGEMAIGLGPEGGES